MSDPWLKFYTNDWVSDPKLRMCSLAARGLWIEMICVMHEAEPYGHLLVSGISPTDAQLAVLVGTPPDQIPELIGELEQVGVFSRTRKSVIYSRKMTRDHKKAVTAKKNGRNGGNPSLCKTREKIPSDNPPLNPRDKPQKPEARSQNKKETKVSQKRKTRIREDSVISQRQFEIAAGEGHGLEEAKAQFERFKSSNLASGRTYVDWDAAWRNWLRSPYFKPVLPPTETTGGDFLDSVIKRQARG